MKGTAGFLGYQRLTSLTHTGESLLAAIRDGSVGVRPEIVSALLALVDVVRRMLAGIVANQGDGGVDGAPLEESRRLLHPGVRAVHADVADVAIEPPATTSPASSATQSKSPASAGPVGETVVPSKAAFAPGAPPSAEAANAPRAALGSIRVDIGLLERLTNLVGELVLTRNQRLQFKSTREDPGFLTTSQRPNLITTELQEGVMKARMQPIGTIWGKYPRVVRDLSLAFDKQVRIEMEGAQTELDRTIIEAIKDPLTHLIRNAIDHGIELPAERAGLGKPAQGRITLRAFHEGGQVDIEIADDGRGIDVGRIRAKAASLSLFSPEQAARMTEREWLNVIFTPGFSTADVVSRVSGRGVGMDVVRTNVEKIGGTADLHSRLGLGTSVHLKIPLTLAIIPALIVTTRAPRCPRSPRARTSSCCRPRGGRSGWSSTR